MSTHPPEALRERLRAARTAAMKDRDRAVADALGATLGAIDNAEAVAPEPVAPAEMSGAIAGASVGAGSSDVARRELTGADVEGIVQSEIAGLLSTADEYDSLGQGEAAANLRRGAEALAAVARNR